MAHLWVRAEERGDEARVGLTPQGAATLLADGFEVTVEDSPRRAIPTQLYRDAGARIAPAGSWRQAPNEAIIFGLKELPLDGAPLRHRHIMFGHAYKGQPDGQKLLAQFKAGSGTLYDLEYLVDGAGRRVAAFGYWAGYAGAAVALRCWAAQRHGGIAGPVGSYPSAEEMRRDLAETLGDLDLPNALVIGALGRVGSGACDLCEAMGVSVTRWDMAETAHGGPFSEVLEHEIFFNCILATPGVPV
ncbi:MAG: saccharopine dehydrogenase, partial [Alphaproteobacteria bacterium]|nr:saccharopine dehydrogenase [Alphaproteobacteria bacterium]